MISVWLIHVVRVKKSLWFHVGKHLRGVLEESLFKDRMQRYGSEILGDFLLRFADKGMFENSHSRRWARGNPCYGNSCLYQCV